MARFSFLMSLFFFTSTPNPVGIKKARRKCVAILNNEVIVDALALCKRVKSDSCK